MRPLFDYSPHGGPDYSNHPIDPLLGRCRAQRLLELPVTSVYCGPLRQLGRLCTARSAMCPTFFSGFSRFGLLERIALTPEGVSDRRRRCAASTLRLASGLPVLVLSFHSPSLAPGHTPYAATQAAVEALYDWFVAVYADLAQRGVRSRPPWRKLSRRRAGNSLDFRACLPAMRQSRGLSVVLPSGALRLPMGPVAQRLELAAHNG